MRGRLNYSKTYKRQGRYSSYTISFSFSVLMDSKQERDSAEAELVKAQEELRDSLSDNEEMQRQLIDLEADITALKRDVHTERNERLRVSQALLQRQREYEELEAELQDALASQERRMEEEERTASERSSASTEEMKRLSTTIKNMKEELLRRGEEIQSLRRTRQEEQDRFLRSDSKATSMTKQVEELNAMLSNMRQELQQREEEIRSLEHASREEQEKARRSESRSVMLENEVSNLQAQLANRDSKHSYEVNQQQGQLRRAQEERNKLLEEVQQLRSRLHSTNIKEPASETTARTAHDFESLQEEHALVLQKLTQADTVIVRIP